MIGSASVLLMLMLGRIAGVTGILIGALPSASGDWIWRAAFLAGMIIAPVVFTALTGTALAFEATTGLPMLIASGLIVGIGVVLGSGCTSGHGVCGLARFSIRSLVAVAVFMATAFATVFVIRHILGA
jgi:uncharacterized membrane protein YedE/YeeE